MTEQEVLRVEEVDPDEGDPAEEVSIVMRIYM